MGNCSAGYIMTMTVTETIHWIVLKKTVVAIIWGVV